MKPDAWMKSGKYLPPILRDFHDQKDLFKAMHQIVSVDKHDYCKEVGWIEGQCYVIDIFLWFMARRGYTLQKSRQRFEFNDLQAEMNVAKEVRDRAAAKALGLTPID
jgi:hypothetical protein